MTWARPPCCETFANRGNCRSRRGRFANRPYSPMTASLRARAVVPASGLGTVVEVFADHHHGAARVAGNVLGDAAHDEAAHTAETAAEALVADYYQAGDYLLAEA